MRATSSQLRKHLLEPEEASEMEAHGSKDAGVLVPAYESDGRLTLVFTERRQDLRRHAGEISFPGGRPDSGDESLLGCALRESQEEIGLNPDAVEVLGALPPTSTFITGYRIMPFVGLIPAGLRFDPSPDEVERVLELTVDELLAGHAMRRLIRRGVPFRTPTYTVGGHLIWGATARILEGFLDRLDAAGRG